MKITVQKRLAAQILKTSPKKVRVDPSQLTTVKESITKADIRGLISSGAISKKKTSQKSQGRARKIISQKRKGRQQGAGRRKGTLSARADTKSTWVDRIRAQRKFLQTLKEKQYITNKTYRALYAKSHGGYFRNVRHIKLFIAENGLAQEK